MFKACKSKESIIRVSSMLILLLVFLAASIWIVNPVIAASDGAAFRADLNVPDGTTFTAGQSFDKGWRLYNSGGTTWSGFQAVRTAGDFGPSSFGVPTVSPGQTGDLWARGISAPSSAGHYRATYRLQGPRGQFGDSFWVDINVQVPQPTNDNAVFRGDLSVPDGTTFTAGQSFDKGWRLYNSGGTTWSGFQAVRTAGDFGPSSFGVSTVSPGQTGDLWARGISAPSSAGHYRATYRLQGPRGQFGDSFWVDINVQVPPPPNDNHSYNRQAAFNYAQKYWNKIGSDGCFWDQSYPPTTGLPVGGLLGSRENSGYDCSHFVSLCIGNEVNEQGGGLDVPSGVAPAYGEPGAGNLGNWLISSGNGIEVNTVDQLEMGDVINYDWDNNDTWDHIAIYLGNDKVAAHSNSFWNVDWRLGGSKFRMIHINVSQGNTYVLTYLAGPNGTISGNSTQTVSSGGSGTAVSANPNSGYHFVSWSDGLADNPRTDTGVSTNITVTANFVTNDYQDSWDGLPSKH